jgi:hypothetical protein
MLIGLQRAGHIDRKKMIELQARYLREITIARSFSPAVFRR